MGKSQKKSAPWMLFAKGILLAMVLYVALQLLLALLTAKAVLPEKHIYQIQVVTCLLSVLAGGLFSAKRSSGGTLLSALIVAGGFAILQLLVGFLAFDGIAWTKHGMGLLLAVLCGGVLAGLLSSKKGRRQRKKHMPVGK